ncbi:hypothetical protein RND71_000885 [Anisodus tanguticus]|uniref:FRIGIDA-like protein n=1 Tax=Anisodus tanguticus TaxID=243964 RepID=A0AAE1T0E7_9SOLA|nr:hypothetical protein RND71_000885 [Anisodus tanguticus]
MRAFNQKRQFLVEQGHFEQRMKDIMLREEKIKDRLEELESREKHCEDRSKELGEKEKQLTAITVAFIKTEPTKDVAVDRINTIVGNSAVTTSVVIMDGKSLQTFLNEHQKELDFMSDDVFEALQMSPNPAKLVLDAMEGFYPPHFRKRETEFEGFVQNLLTKQQHLEAIRYAYAFGLVEHFPPSAILKDYLECVDCNYVDVYEKETCSVQEKIEAIERSVASVRAVIRCILDYKLQSQYPVEQLEEQIELLTRQKEDQAALSVICVAKKPEQANVNQMGSTNPSIPTGTLSSASFSATAPFTP